MTVVECDDVTNDFNRTNILSRLHQLYYDSHIEKQLRKRMKLSLNTLFVRRYELYSLFIKDLHIRHVLFVVQVENIAMDHIWNHICNI